MSKNPRDFTENEVLKFIKDSNINSRQKEILTKAFKENGIDGKMLINADGTFEDSKELADGLGITKLVIKKFMSVLENAVNKYNEEQKSNNQDDDDSDDDGDDTDDDSDDDVDDDEEAVRRMCARLGVQYNNMGDDSNRVLDSGKFSLNVRGEQGKLHVVPDVSIATSFKDLKRFYIDVAGGDISKLGFTVKGKVAQDNQTLGFYKIDKFSRTVVFSTFKVRGGSEIKDDEKEITIKKIKKKNKKKNKNKKKKSKKKNDEIIDGKIRSIKNHCNNPKIMKLLTTKPDDINLDDRKQLRCKMECGHVIGSSSMYYVLKILFLEKLSSKKVICPVPKCGTEWDFDLCLIIADLTNEEVFKFTDIFERRNSDGCCFCPTCKTKVARPKDLTHFRVYHGNCPHYCWSCGGNWKNGPSLQVCGNNNCPNLDIVEALKNCQWSEIKCGNTSVTVPDFRLCPQCFTFINKNEGCKDVPCTGCGTHFCFGCLKIGNHACGGGWGGCATGIAPTQTLK